MWSMSLDSRSSKYGFTWWIYNSDYENCVQVGIQNGKVVGLYTNSLYWDSKKGIGYGSSPESVQSAYGTPLSYITKGNAQYKTSENPNESNTFLIDDAHATIFYDTYDNGVVTAVLLIDKNVETASNGYYGNTSEALVQAYERQLFDLANAIRGRKGLSAYTWDDLACISSEYHSLDMAKNHFFSHTNLEGESLYDRMEAQTNIRGVMRNHPNKPRIEELVIVSINDAVALDTKLTFDPFPLALKDHFINDFPLEIPVIDKNNPFRMDISGFGFRDQAFGEEPVKLILEFNDIVGNRYKVEQMINPHKNLQPMAIGEDINERLVKAIENLVKKLG